MLIGPLLSDAARPEFPKVTSAHDNHSWLSISYMGSLSQLWQNSPFCDKFCDKTVVQNYINCDKDINISGWRKKRLLRGPRKCVAIRRFFHPRKSLHFILNHSKLHCFFQPSETCILPSISVYADACLVWLVYLIHELDWTSKWSFFFNQKDPNYSIVRFNKELNLKRVSSKTVKDWCGKPVFRGYFLFCCLPEPFL